MLAAVMTACAVTTTAFAKESTVPPSVISEAYVVMDAETGQVLIEKNMNRREYPASITKILTVALALENSDLDDRVTVSQDAVYAIEPNSSHIALQPDEVVRMRDLLYATMLPSANDAANVAAEYVGGSMEKFAEMMNKKAAELGCGNTHFVNANGLPDDDHYTTAYDMALITKYAIGVTGFLDIFGYQDVYQISPTNKQEQARRFGTEHMMLVESKYYYEGTLGGKLGWTEEAKHTIVTLARRNDMTLICVAMKSPQRYDKFNDSIALFDYCFDNFEPVAIPGDQLKTFSVSHYRSGGSAENVSISGEESYRFLVHKSVGKDAVEISYNVPEYYSDENIDPSVSFSVDSGSMYGEIGSFPMAFQTVAIEELPAEQNQEDVPKETFADQFLGVMKIVGYGALGLLGLILLAFLVMLVIRFCNKYRRWHRRRARNRRIAQLDDPDLIVRRPQRRGSAPPPGRRR